MEVTLMLISLESEVLTKRNLVKYYNHGHNILIQIKIPIRDLLSNVSGEALLMQQRDLGLMQH